MQRAMWLCFVASSVAVVRRRRVVIPLALVLALLVPGVGQAQVGSNLVTVSPTQGPAGLAGHRERYWMEPVGVPGDDWTFVCQRLVSGNRGSGQSGELHRH